MHAAMIEQDSSPFVTFLAPVGEELEHTADRANRLLTVTTALANAATAMEVAGVTLGVGLSVAEAARGLFACREPGGVNIIHMHGFDAALQRAVIGLYPRDICPLTRCVLTGDPVYLRTVHEYQTRFPWAYDRIGAVSATQACAALPLVHDGKVIGGIGLTFPKPTSFGVADRAFMVLLARAAAGALARALAFDDSRKGRLEADALARAREEILSIVAHDLRNPLHLLTGTAELLADTDLPAQQRRTLMNVSARAAQQMNGLIGDLLDGNRIQNGTLLVHRAACSLDGILGQTEETLRPIAERAGIALRTERREPCDSQVCVDASRIVQALGNLVGNAVKFTPRGGTVTVRAAMGRKTVAFAVIDNGPGISADDRRHLFERFWQATRDRRGVGLGLTIVKGIAEAHGGRVVLRSERGRGSMFAIVCPR